MKLGALLLLVLFVSLVGAVDVEYGCEYKDCIEGTNIEFNLTFAPQTADFVPEEKWKPETMHYEYIEIFSGGEAVASSDERISFEDAATTSSLVVEGVIPHPTEGKVELTLCLNKSVSGQIYALSTGVTSGSSQGEIHSRNTFLFGWSKYTKPAERSCEQFGTMDVIPRSEIGCLEDEECSTDERCMDYNCEVVLCEGCEFAENHACYAYECCSSEMCAPGEECASHECVELTCREDQIEETHYCRDVICGLLQKREGKGCVLDLAVLAIIAVVGVVGVLLWVNKTQSGPKWYNR